MSTTEQRISVERLKTATIFVQIEGVTPLIPHRWSEKARKMMLDAQTGKATTKKPPKDPQADFEASLYVHPDGWYGMPATAFKAAIADAARYFDKSITITGLKRSVFVIGHGPDQLVRIGGSEPQMREDTVRNASGVADLRYRGQFDPWEATLAIEYVDALYTAETIVNLVDAAGLGGVGDWRPSAPKSNSGTYGRFQVVGGDTLEVAGA